MNFLDRVFLFNQGVIEEVEGDGVRCGAGKGNPRGTAPRGLKRFWR